MRQHRQSVRILRLIACCLTVPGLLGHGLSTLVAGLLLAPPTAIPGTVADGPEICRAGNTTEHQFLRRTGDRKADDSPETPAPAHGGGAETCAVCSAFAQNGIADLPLSSMVAGDRGRAAEPLRTAPEASASLFSRQAICRGPPESAGSGRCFVG